ncbi:MAG: PhzF family phenazine biosynthesis protein [Clostridiaceae bacterium]|nr:PhzF family phenazine biosynthesis protein [Eubacteriales bacterium]
MQLYIVDAFSQSLFGGNPAGVVLTEAPLPERYMRYLAAELRYSETAFVLYEGGSFSARYFTPTDEVSLCGHATIAAFTALRHAGIVRPGAAYDMKTNAGLLRIDVLADSVWMDMAAPVSLSKIGARDLNALYEALDLRAADMPKLPAEIISSGLPDIMLPVSDRETLNDIVPDFKTIAELSLKHSVVGLHVFALGGDGVRAYCRNFAPVYGIDEEAATGTSNGALTYYLYRHGFLETDTVNRFVQGEAMQRPSSVLTTLVHRGDTPVVRVGGSGAILSCGELFT